MLRKSINSKEIYLTLLFIVFAGFYNILHAQKSEAIAIKPKVVDNGYYKYEKTGNSVKDAENESKAKQDFIAKHPEQYEKMKAASNQASKQVIDYKEYINMPANKKAHIDANPDKYTFINK